jgi:hypothetical protein
MAITCCSNFRLHFLEFKGIRYTNGNVLQNVSIKNVDENFFDNIPHPKKQL